MFLEIAVLIIEFLLFSFLVGLPVLKRRPLFIRNFALAILVLFIFSLVALFNHPIFYVIGFVLAIIIYYFQSPWIIFGLYYQQLQDSWSQSLSMTKTPNKEIRASFRTFGRLSIVTFQGKNNKKTKLVQNLFRKLIANHRPFLKDNQ